MSPIKPLNIPTLINTSNLEINPIGNVHDHVNVPVDHGQQEQCECECRHALRHIHRLGRQLPIIAAEVAQGGRELWESVCNDYQMGTFSGIGDVLDQLTDRELASIVIAMQACHCCDRHQHNRPEFN